MSDDHAISKRSYIAAIAFATCLLVGAVRADEITLFEPTVRGTATRVLHFPPDRCVGNLYMPPESVPTWAPKLVCPNNWECIGTAQGDVAVRGDQGVELSVWLRPRPGDMVGLSVQDRQAYQMVTANRTRADPEDLSGLSGLRPDDLSWLLVCTGVPRRDADRLVLEPIQRLTGLQILSLSGTGVTDKGMERLRALRSLKALDLRERSIGSAGLAILKDLPALEYLDLYTGVTDVGLKQVAQAGSIRWLRIRTGGFWGPGLAELAQMPRLERLCLWGDAQITDRHIAHLEGLTQIKALTLWGSACDNLTDASLAAIGKLRNLEELYFIRTSPRFTPVGVAYLKDLKKLRKVDFSGAWVVADSVGYGGGNGDEAMRQLAAVLPDLESLEGAGMLSAEGVKVLGAFRNLRRLDIVLKDRHQGYNGPTGLSCLGGLSSLEELTLSGQDALLSEADMACLASLRRLKVLSVMNTHLTDRGLTALRELEGLERLNLIGTRVSRNGLNQLSSLKNLQSLSVGMWAEVRPTNVTEELPLDLSQLQSLTQLHLSGVALQEADVTFLANLRHLKDVKIDANCLPATSLRHLKGLSELECLSVRGLSRPTAEDLAPLARLAKVRTLRLGGDIADTAVASLEGFPGLQWLDVETAAPICNQTIAELKQRLPMIEYVHISEPLPQPAVSPQRPGGSPPRRSLPASPPRPRRR